jgi:hypothetical protein
LSSFPPLQGEDFYILKFFCSCPILSEFFSAFLELEFTLDQSQGVATIAYCGKKVFSSHSSAGAGLKPASGICGCQ